MKLKTKAKIMLGSLLISGLITNANQISRIYAVQGPGGVSRPRTEETAALNIRKLFSLIQHNNISEFKEMINSGMDVNNIRDGLNWTPLHFAAMMGRYEMVRYLVERCGANTQVVDGSGFTPLALALRNDEQLVATYLYLHRSDAIKVNWRQPTLHRRINVSIR